MADKIEDGGLAFPGKRWQQVDIFIDSDGETNPTFADVTYPGMSLRDWFAGQALATSCALAFEKTERASSMGYLPEEWAARIAYSVADEMIAARKGEL